MKKDTLLIIAGFDPSQGSGILLDLRIAKALQIKSFPLISSLALQNNQSFFGLQSFSQKDILIQLDSLDSNQIGAIKMGAAGSIKIWDILISKIKKLDIPLVVDPVFKTSSGGKLINEIADQSIRNFYIEKLAPLSTLFTPNYQEARFLLDDQLNIFSVEELAKKLYQKMKCAILITGGHPILSHSETLTDTLIYMKNGKILFKHFSHPKFEKGEIRGTGCALSTAICTQILKGIDLENACRMGIDQVQNWIEIAQEVEPNLYHLYP